ncbi:MAG: hypothetical protein KGL39_60735 [Patescibacteria group bacterium]|nr:hypothetical protein [Patescibacteria group bacterium]
MTTQAGSELSVGLGWERRQMALKKRNNENVITIKPRTLSTQSEILSFPYFWLKNQAFPVPHAPGIRMIKAI